MTWDRAINTLIEALRQAQDRFEIAWLVHVVWLAILITACPTAPYLCDCVWWGWWPW